MTEIITNKRIIIKKEIINNKPTENTINKTYKNNKNKNNYFKFGNNDPVKKLISILNKIEDARIKRKTIVNLPYKLSKDLVRELDKLGYTVGKFTSKFDHMTICTRITWGY